MLERKSEDGAGLEADQINAVNTLKMFYFIQYK